MVWVLGFGVGGGRGFGAGVWGRVGTCGVGVLGVWGLVGAGRAGLWGVGLAGVEELWGGGPPVEQAQGVFAR